jgi:hypothetical protein
MVPATISLKNWSMCTFCPLVCVSHSCVNANGIGSCPMVIAFAKSKTLLRMSLKE